MRKNTARHWLHATLDLLPVILIPVFMVYSHRHDVAQDFEIVEEAPVYYETNEVSSYNDLLVDNIYHWDGNSPSIPSLTTNYFIFDIKATENLTFIQDLEDVNVIVLYVNSGGLAMRVTYNDATQVFPNVKTRTFDFVIDNITTSINYAEYIIQHISSSQMELVKEYQEVITNIPKDVMTSFIDRFNNTVNTYFNMGNVFNLKDVYHWFEVNIFNNQAPLVMESIYNIIVYEFIMDLLFLLYGLFMWFVDMLKKLMEKPLDSIK